MRRNERMVSVAAAAFAGAGYFKFVN